jgi:hypothetical protein
VGTHGRTQGLAAGGRWLGEGPAPEPGQVICLHCGEQLPDPDEIASGLSAAHLFGGGGGWGRSDRLRDWLLPSLNRGSPGGLGEGRRQPAPPAR